MPVPIGSVNYLSSLRDSSSISERIRLVYTLFAGLGRKSLCYYEKTGSERVLLVPNASASLKAPLREHGSGSRGNGIVV